MTSLWITLTFDSSHPNSLTSPEKAQKPETEYSINLIRHSLIWTVSSHQAAIYLLSTPLLKSSTCSVTCGYSYISFRFLWQKFLLVPVDSNISVDLSFHMPKEGWLIPEGINFMFEFFFF